MRAQDGSRLPTALNGVSRLFRVLKNKHTHQHMTQTNNDSQQRHTFMTKQRVDVWKSVQRENNKWHSGLPKHIKSTFIILDVLFLSIIIDPYILLVLNKLITALYCPADSLVVDLVLIAALIIPSHGDRRCSSRNTNREYQ